MLVVAGRHRAAARSPLMPAPSLPPPLHAMPAAGWHGWHVAAGWPLQPKKYTFDDDFGGSYTFDDSESQPTSTLLMIPPYPVGCRDVPAARKHKGSVGTSWMYEIDVLRAKDESADLLSCCWLVPKTSA